MTKCSWKYVFGLFIGLLFMSAAGEAFATEGANAATEKKVETFVGATKLGDKKDQDGIDQVKQTCADAKKKVKPQPLLFPSPECFSVSQNLHTYQRWRDRHFHFLQGR